MENGSLQQRLNDCDNLFCPDCNKETPHIYAGLDSNKKHQYRCGKCKSTHNDEQIKAAVLKAYNLSFKKQS